MLVESLLPLNLLQSRILDMHAYLPKQCKPVHLTLLTVCSLLPCSGCVQRLLVAAVWIGLDTKAHKAPSKSRLGLTSQTCHQTTGRAQPTTYVGTAIDNQVCCVGLIHASACIHKIKWMSEGSYWQMQTHAQRLYQHGKACSTSRGASFLNWSIVYSKPVIPKAALEGKCSTKGII